MSSFTNSTWPSIKAALIDPGRGCVTGHDVGTGLGRLPCRGMHIEAMLPDRSAVTKLRGGKSSDLAAIAGDTLSASKAVSEGFLICPSRLNDIGVCEESPSTN